MQIMPASALLLLNLADVQKQNFKNRKFAQIFSRIYYTRIFSFKAYAVSFCKVASDAVAKASRTVWQNGKLAKSRCLWTKFSDLKERMAGQEERENRRRKKKNWKKNWIIQKKKKKKKKTKQFFCFLRFLRKKKKRIIKGNKVKLKHFNIFIV